MSEEEEMSDQEFQEGLSDLLAGRTKLAEEPTSEDGTNARAMTAAVAAGLPVLDSIMGTLSDALNAAGSLRSEIDPDDISPADSALMAVCCMMVGTALASALRSLPDVKKAMIEAAAREGLELGGSD